MESLLLLRVFSFSFFTFVYRFIRILRMLIRRQSFSNPNSMLKVLMSCCDVRLAKREREREREACSACSMHSGLIGLLCRDV